MWACMGEVFFGLVYHYEDNRGQIWASGHILPNSEGQIIKIMHILHIFVLYKHTEQSEFISLGLGKYKPDGLFL